MIAEDTMFFPKLRAHAKWMFVLLAAVFSLGFVFLGVGSGSSGIGDLLQGNWSQLFGSGSGTSAQISKDEKKIKADPKDYAAYRDLAAAQATKGKIDDGIATLLQLKSVHPRDVAGLTQLASLYLQKGDSARTVAINAQTRAQETVTPGAFAPAATTPLGKVYKTFTEPLSSQLSSGATTAFSNAYTKMTSAYSQAVGAYKAVAAVTPNDPSVQFALGQTAEQAQDLTTAIAAYRAFLKLAPEDPSASAIKARIKTLQAQQAATPSVSSGSSSVTTG